MESQANPVAAELQVPKAESPRKNLMQVISTISGAAFATFVLGAFFGAAWPGAVASCGISLMGVVVAYFMLRDGRNS